MIIYEVLCTHLGTCLDHGRSLGSRGCNVCNMHAGNAQLVHVYVCVFVCTLGFTNACRCLGHRELETQPSCRQRHASLARVVDTHKQLDHYELEVHQS